MAQSAQRDPFGARSTFNSPAGPVGFYNLNRLEELGIAPVSRLPFSIRILLEAALRNCDGYVVTKEDVENLAKWNAANPAEVEIPFMPARVVLQDFTACLLSSTWPRCAWACKPWGETLAKLIR